MSLTEKQLNLTRWSARILSLAILLFSLPFYFGYGNPLPFIDSSYTLWDNLWLSIFPWIFIGLALGWKYEKIGGYLSSISVLIGLVGGLILEGEIVWFMFVPFIAGILYLICAYNN